MIKRDTRGKVTDCYRLGQRFQTQMGQAGPMVEGPEWEAVGCSVDTGKLDSVFHPMAWLLFSCGFLMMLGNLSVFQDLLSVPDKNLH